MEGQGNFVYLELSFIVLEGFYECWCCHSSRSNNKISPAMEHRKTMAILWSRENKTNMLSSVSFQSKYSVPKRKIAFMALLYFISKKEA